MEKKGQMWDTFIPWIIAIVILALVIFAAIFMKDKLVTWGSYIKDLFR